MAQAFSCNFCFAEVTLEDEPGKQSRHTAMLCSSMGTVQCPALAKLHEAGIVWGGFALCNQIHAKEVGGLTWKLGTGMYWVLEKTVKSIQVKGSFLMHFEIQLNSSLEKKSNPFEGAFAKCFIFFHRQMPAERRWPWLQVAFMQVSFLVPRPWEFGM